MTIDECLTKPKKPHPKNPSVKSMAPPAPRECNQPARSVLHRKQSAHRSALHRNQFAAHRLAHRIPCIAAHCIASCTAQRTARMQPARAHRPAHRKQSAHQQPTRHASPAAPAKARGFIKTLFFAHRPPHGAHLTHAVLPDSQYFALVSFGSWY
jgi:hypothetical protein